MPFAEVAVYSGRPDRGTFSYAIPPHLAIRVGDGVYVPFGRQTLQGVVLQLTETPAVSETREIRARIDEGRLLTRAQATLARWIADAYLAPISRCAGLFLPPGFQRKPRRWLRVTEAGRAANASLTGDARALVDAVRAKRELAFDALPKRLGKRRSAMVRKLVDRGLLEERFDLAPPGVREKVETWVELTVSENAARAAVRDWPQSKRSRPAELLTRLGEGPIPLTEARRLVGGGAMLERFLATHSVVERTGSELRATADAETLQHLIAALRRTRAERAQVALLRALVGGPVSESDLKSEFDATAADIDALVEAGRVRRVRRRVERDPLADLVTRPVEQVKLTADQARAYRAIADALARAREEGNVVSARPSGVVFLLQGVTGSGKTEVYLAAAENAIAHGGRVIVLVPEIALTPQTIERFATRFPGRVAVQHSELSLGEDYDQWQRIRSGHADVVIGSRSALFAPQPNLRLVIVDEEHEWTYKQTDSAPRYHVREVVEEYCRLTGAVAVFGTATPDVVTAARAQRRRYRRLHLPQRVHSAVSDGRSAPAQPVPLPAVEIVDLREELRAGNRSIFSRALTDAIGEVLEVGAQLMLLLNRRGVSGLVCRGCGEALICPRCAVPLTMHAEPEVLRCHECGYATAPQSDCPSCGQDLLRPLGLGTQRLEQAVRRHFPSARPIRWDRDTTRRRGGHEQILKRFQQGEANVLIGTQMIATGLDLPAVTLVGVVNADLALRLPDYTGPERTFQLLAQVAGRAGRGPRGGRVIVQSYVPDHYAILAAAAHDYTAFFEAEMAARAQHDYPPFGRLARLVYQHSNDARARETAVTMAAQLREERDRRGLPGPEVLGPTPAYVYQRRGRYRWQITLRGADPIPLLRLCSLPQGWTVDIDPVSLL